MIRLVFLSALLLLSLSSAIAEDESEEIEVQKGDPNPERGTPWPEIVSEWKVGFSAVRSFMERLTFVRSNPPSRVSVLESTLQRYCWTLLVNNEQRRNGYPSI